MGWKVAGRADVEILLRLMQDFYLEEGLEFDGGRMALALDEMLERPEWGSVFVLCDGRDVRGYFVVGVGFSLEFGGRFALLDELYVAPLARGSGEGRKALAVFEAWAKERGVFATRLEVNAYNDKARAIYTANGYGDGERQILSKWLREKSGENWKD